MRHAITRFFVQQGSSQDIQVSDNDAWYVIRQVWPDAHALHRCEIETKCASRPEALGLADIYNSPPEPLATLAEWSGISRSTLRKAVNATPQRLRASKRGKVWMSTRRAVLEYKAGMILKPRRLENG